MKLRASIGCYVLSVYFALCSDGAGLPEHYSSLIDGSETDFGSSSPFPLEINESRDDSTIENIPAFYENETDLSDFATFFNAESKSDADLPNQNSSVTDGNEENHGSTSPSFTRENETHADSREQDSSAIHENETGLSDLAAFFNAESESDADLPKQNSSVTDENEEDHSSSPLFAHENGAHADSRYDDPLIIHANETALRTNGTFPRGEIATQGEEEEEAFRTLSPLSVDRNKSNADSTKHNSSEVPESDKDLSIAPQLSHSGNEASADSREHSFSETHGNVTETSRLILGNKTNGWDWLPQNVTNSRVVISPELVDTVLDKLDLTNERVKQIGRNEALFYLFTKENYSQFQRLLIGSTESIRRSFFNSSNPTVFITHRWLNGFSVASCTTLRDAYLAGPKDVNVIMVDFNPFNMKLRYNSVTRVSVIGQRIARMINFLKKEAKLKLELTTLVGHSMGAHVMGVAGRYTDGEVQQIFALDPARKLFEDANSVYRLTKKSAKNVQVIHTNGHEQGLFEPLGHSDFYPNGGVSQPGCENYDTSSNGACSHGRAYYLFAESLNPSLGFDAVRCEIGENLSSGECSGPVGRMGGRDTNQSPTSGVFYLKTTDVQPYAMLMTKKAYKH
ncbi:uncharacterized protein [Venturia canescens]|uniref:uncharacterized protein n=1 Tax=Venturia canescens TaxID=32260 RepID=UPI001C9C73D3|nr:uncharacterized protein LOC122408899 [Venturia canescens]